MGRSVHSVRLTSALGVARPVHSVLAGQSTHWGRPGRSARLASALGVPSRPVTVYNWTCDTGTLRKCRVSGGFGILTMLRSTASLSTVDDHVPSSLVYPPRGNPGQGQNNVLEESLFECRQPWSSIVINFMHESDRLVWISLEWWRTYALIPTQTTKANSEEEINCPRLQWPASNLLIKTGHVGMVLAHGAISYVNLSGKVISADILVNFVKVFGFAKKCSFEFCQILLRRCYVKCSFFLLHLVRHILTSSHCQAQRKQAFEPLVVGMLRCYWCSTLR
jgi:hypothetical protein